MALSKLKCIVTGASSGIGRETCKVLTNQGAKVVGIGRNEEALIELKEEGGVCELACVVRLARTLLYRRIHQKRLSHAPFLLVM